LLLDSIVQMDRTGLILDAIVADGMSSDGTRDTLAAFAKTHARFTVIDNSARIVSTGLNRAIRLSQSEFIVRMDAHTVYETDYVIRCIEALQQNHAANAGGPQRSKASGFWQRAIHAGFHSPFASGGARFRSDDYRGPVDTLPYGCWRKELMIAVGLFDETLVRNQDDELNMRIRQAGGIVWQDPSIVSWYSPRTALKGLFRQYLQFGFWRVRVLKKHPASGSLRHFVPALAALVGVCLVAWIASGRERHAALIIALALAASYLALSLYASFKAAHREGWDLLAALPITFATYQAGYACGFCIGLIYWGSRRIPRTFYG
jgi:succinoglycan biosynthesis protein ExoA